MVSPIDTAHPCKAILDGATALMLSELQRSRSPQMIEIESPTLIPTSLAAWMETLFISSRDL
jgi:hypothetical protein